MLKYRNLTGIEALKNYFQGNTGYVSIHSADETGKWKNLGFFSAEDIKDLPETDKDNFYFSCNTFIEKNRKTANVKEVVSLYCDLDLPLMMPISDAEEFIDDLVDRDIIPQPSIIGYSGRGMWLYYKLEPFLATYDALEQYRGLQKLLFQQLGPLGIDKKCVDLARVTRVPGSFNTRNHKKVTYLTWDIVYNLDDLYKEYKHNIKVEPINQPPQDDEGGKTVKSSLTKGFIDKKSFKPNPILFMKGQTYIKRLDKLNEIRGGISKGSRRQFLWLYSTALKTTFNNSAEDFNTNPYESLLLVNTALTSPLNIREVYNAFKSAKKNFKFTNKFIINTLDIKVEEAKECGWIITLDLFPNAPYNLLYAPDKKYLRRQYILRHPNHSYQDIRKGLLRKGFKASRATIYRDITATVNPATDQKKTL